MSLFSQNVKDLASTRCMDRLGRSATPDLDFTTVFHELAFPLMYRSRRRHVAFFFANTVCRPLEIFMKV